MVMENKWRGFGKFWGVRRDKSGWQAPNPKSLCRKRALLSHSLDRVHGPGPFTR